MPPTTGIILSPNAFSRIKQAVRRVELDRGRRPWPGLFGGMSPGSAEHWFVIVQSSTNPGTGATAIPHAWHEAQWSASTEAMAERSTTPHQTGFPARPRRSSQEGTGTGADPYARPGYNAAAPEVPIPDDTLCLCVLQQDDEGEAVWLLWPVAPNQSMQVILQTSPTELIADRKWLYTGHEARRASTANRPWAEVSGGLVIQCYNDHEDLLVSQHESFEGAAACPAGTEAPPMTIKRLAHQAGTPVRVWLNIADDGEPVWSFDKLNPVQICCGTPT